MNIERNKTNCHSKLDLESSTQVVYQQQRQASKILNQVQDDFLVKHHGFTLIELLIVVLIIGILSAIAVPQYQKAVIRTKLANARAILKTIIQAQESYYLTHGVYAKQLNQLDVNLPSDGTCPQVGDICVQLTDYIVRAGEPHLYGVRASLKEPSNTSNGYIYFLNDGPGMYKDIFPRGLYCTDNGSKGYCEGGRISYSFFGLGMFKAN